MENKLKAMLGTIKGSEIGPNRDSSSDVRLLSSEITSPEDVQTIELITNGGQDFSPEDEDVVLVISLGDAYKIGLVIDDQIAPDETLEKGEFEYFSKSDGVKKAKIRLNKDSEVILNDGVDFAVGYNELKSQIDKLRVDLLAHVHTGVTVGGGNSGVSPTVFDVNVDGTKIDKVRL